MGHWRDGGIGNVPGSDDRPIEEWTLLERLASIGGGGFRHELDPNSVADLAQECFNEIVRLRTEIEQIHAEAEIAGDYE